MKNYEVIVIGGSFAGLSAAMTLGRSLRKILIIDGGKPCNLKSPEAHNFITHDGEKPLEIISNAREQVLKYDTIDFLKTTVVRVDKKDGSFIVKCDDESGFSANKILFATGVKDIMPNIYGFEECWGKSILHCPYCHGYEVKDKNTAILANGDNAFEFAKLIYHWSKDLMIFTNGKSTLTNVQHLKLKSLGIAIFEKNILSFIPINGKIKSVIFDDQSKIDLDVIYYRPVYEQHCKIPEQLGCVLDEHGLLAVDGFNKTNIAGIYAAGDNSSLLRSISGACASGTKAGAVVNMELIEENF